MTHKSLYLLFAVTCVLLASRMSLANPVPFEVYPEVIAEPESGRVIFSFLGMETSYTTDMTITPGVRPNIVVVEIRENGEWKKMDGDWVGLDKVYFENGLSVAYDVYTRFAQVWPCPAAGAFETRIAQYAEDDDVLVDISMIEASVDCGAVGDPNNVSLDNVAFTEYDEPDSEDIAQINDDSEEISTDTTDTGTGDTDSQTAEVDDGNKTDGGGCALALRTVSSGVSSLWKLLFSLF